CESKVTSPTGGSSRTVSEDSAGRMRTLAVSGPTSTEVAGTSSSPTIAPSTATTAVVVTRRIRRRRCRSRRRRRERRVGATVPVPGSSSCGGWASCEVTSVSAEEAHAARLLGGDLGVGDLRAGDQHGAALVVDQRDGGAVGDRAVQPLDQGLGLLLGLDHDLARGVLDT